MKLLEKRGRDLLSRAAVIKAERRDEAPRWVAKCPKASAGCQRTGSLLPWKSWAGKWQALKQAMGSAMSLCFLMNSFFTDEPTKSLD